MISKIIVINGKGGVGKDTLIDGLDPQKYDIVNESSIDPIKDLYSDFIAGKEKSNAVRALLAGGKKILDDFYMAEHGYSYTSDYLCKRLEDFLKHRSEDKVNIMFVHIREPEKIQEFIDLAKTRLTALRDRDTDIHSLLVQAPAREKSDYGNSSDNNVENFSYDFYYTLTDDKETEQKKFEEFFDGLIINHTYFFDKTDFSDIESCKENCGTPEQFNKARKQNNKDHYMKE